MYFLLLIPQSRLTLSKCSCWFRLVSQMKHELEAMVRLDVLIPLLWARLCQWLTKCKFTGLLSWYVRTRDTPNRVQITVSRGWGVFLTHMGGGQDVYLVEALHWCSRSRGYLSSWPRNTDGVWHMGPWGPPSPPGWQRLETDNRTDCVMCWFCHLQLESGTQVRRRLKLKFFKVSTHSWFQLSSAALLLREGSLLIGLFCSSSVGVFWAWCGCSRFFLPC